MTTLPLLYTDLIALAIALFGSGFAIGLMVARRAGMDEGTALAFAMDRSSYPDWIVPADDPIKKIGWEDGEEDN